MISILYEQEETKYGIQFYNKAQISSCAKEWSETSGTIETEKLIVSLQPNLGSMINVIIIPLTVGTFS